MSQLRYPIIVQPLPVEDGGGFAALVPDLPGCMSDGEPPEQAVANVQDAIAVWIEAAIEPGRTVPKPSTQLALAATGSGWLNGNKLFVHHRSRWKRRGYCWRR